MGRFLLWLGRFSHRQAASIAAFAAVMLVGGVAAYAMPAPPNRQLAQSLDGTSADLAIQLSSAPSDTPAIAGQSSVTYTATVTNNGPDTDTGYTVSLDVPTGTSVTSADPGCAPSGSTEVCTSTSGIAANADPQTFHVTLTIASSFANSSPKTGVTLDETASVATTNTSETDPDLTNNVGETKDNVVAQSDLSVALSADHSGDSPAIAGKTIKYTATVTNNGPSDNGDYSVGFLLPAHTSFDSSTSGCAPAPGAISCPVGGTLIPAHSATYDVTLDIEPSYSDHPPAYLDQTATVASEIDPKSPKTDSDHVPVVAQADLGVQVSVVSTHAVAGGAPADFKVTVTNNGPSDAVGGYKATTTLPVGASLDGSSDASCSAAGQAVTCDRTAVSTLAPSATDSFHIVVDTVSSFADSASPAPVTLDVSLGAFGTTDPNSSNDDAGPVTAQVYREADLGVQVSVVSTHAVAGGAPADFKVTVTNNGPSDAVGGYKATTTLPVGASLDGSSDASCSVAGQVVTCDRTGISTLAPSATDSFHIVVDTLPSFGDGPPVSDATSLGVTITLGSFGTTDPNSTNDSTSATATVFSEADLTITKSATAGPIYANSNTAQNTVTFTITISNAGPSDAHNVAINDALNANLLTNAMYCPGSPCNATSPYAGSISIGTFAAQGSQTFTIVAHANATLGHSTASASPTDYRKAGPYTNSNTATVTSTTPPHTTDHRSAGPVNTEIDTVPASPTIKQAAVGGNGQAAVEWNPSSSSGGQPIRSYTLTACPIGSTTGCKSLTVGPNPNAPPTASSYFSYIISGLTNGVQYQFNVVATNAVGDSDPANAGTAYASASAFVSTIPTTGTLSADTGISGGALTCSDPTLVTCKDIVAQYAFTDTQDVGAVYNLDAEPNTQTQSALRLLQSGGPLLQCLIVGNLDPGKSGFGSVVNSPDCGPSNKIVRDTYPQSSNATPHSEQVQFDSSITTLTRGEPCNAYSVDSTGTAQCTDPPGISPVYTDPYTGRPTNFCPAQFNPSGNIGWSATKPCAFVYYLVEEMPGFDIIGTGQPIANRPVACTMATDSNCGAPAIIASSIRAGITQNGKLLVPPWCNKSLTVVPCVSKYQWLNGDAKTSPNYLDLLITHYQVGDPLFGGSSG